MTISYPDNTFNRNSITASGLNDSSTLFDVVVSGNERKFSLAELKKTGVQVVNVLQYGADPTGVTSSSAAIQAAVDLGLSLYYPQGIYAIDTTIEIPSQYGGQWFGCGAITANSSLTHRPASSLMWTGADGGTIVESSAHALSVSHIGFWGRLSSEATRAGIGFNVLSNAGVGSGQLAFYDVAFCDLDVCVQAGTNSSDTNASDCYFDTVRFTRCKKGLLVKHVQGLNWIFGFVTASQVEDDIFHFEAGGMLDVRYLYGSYINRVLNVSGSGSLVGSNSGEFVIHSLNMDASQWGTGGVTRPAGATNNVPQWVKISQTAAAVRSVRINGGRLHAMAPGRNCPLIEAAGYSIVNVRNVRNITANTFVSTSVVADNTTETFTAIAHGFSNNDRVRIGGTANPSGVSTTTVYYVVNATADTFQISSTSGGAAVTFTTDGTAVTASRIYPLMSLTGHTSGQCACSFSESQFASQSPLIEEKLGTTANATFSYKSNRSSTAATIADSGDY